MKFPTSERGSILLYSLLTMAVMLAIGLTLGSLFVSRLRAATAGRETITALYAADGAIELCLYEARQEVFLGGSPRLAFQSGVTFSMTTTTTDITGLDGVDNPGLDTCTDLGSKSFGFRATGQFRGTRRTLEVTQ